PMGSSRMNKGSSAGRKVASGRNERALDHRLRRLRAQAKAPIEQAEGGREPMRRSVALDCGWGRLIFAQTFSSNEAIIETLRQEEDSRRDIAFYVRDPHVLLSLTSGETFLDPSHTYRLDLSTYRASRRQPKGFFIRR